MSRRKRTANFERGFIKTSDGRTYFVGSDGVRRRSNESGTLLRRAHRVLGISGKSYRRMRLQERRAA